MAGAAAQALTATGISTSVKPPNDVIGSRGRRSGKICGILAEASGSSRTVDWVVLGVGINVNNSVSGVKDAASVKKLTGRSWDQTEILRYFLKSFADAYRRFR
jgi:BirA family biotin operon repressor/biotin-[acetyl-CoA-carboxylase] ligase